MIYKIISVTPVQYIPEINMYKIGMIVQKGNDPVRGGNIYNKDKEKLQYQPNTNINIEEITTTKGGNTIKIKNNSKTRNFSTKKDVNISSNGIEDPF